MSGDALEGVDLGVFQILDAGHIADVSAAGVSAPEHMAQIPEFDPAGFAVLSEDGETSLPAADVMRPLSEKGSDADMPAIADLQPEEAADLPFIADTPEGW